MKLVILAAGFGSRLWPLSTSDHPKQFQRILGDQTLIQYTYDLLSRAAGQDNVYILTLQGLEHLALKQIPTLDTKHLVIVPQRRNTLPHTIVALRQLAANDDEFIHFFSSDNVQNDESGYIQALKKYFIAASTFNPSRLYLQCVKTDDYSTECGYAEVNESGNLLRHIEKPDANTLKRLAANPNAYKRPITFCTTKRALEEALQQVESPVREQCEKLLRVSGHEFPAAYEATDFADISNFLLQKATNMNAYVIENADFTDVGIYASLYNINDKDARQNVVIGNAVVDEHSTGNIIINNTDKPLVVINTKDSAVVSTCEGNLIAPLGDANNVGEIYKTKIHQH